MNVELAKARSKRYRDAHKKELIERSKAWQRSNKDKAAANRARYRKNNPGKVNADQMLRHARKLAATPKWADLQMIEEFYKRAARLTKETGIQHEVDHIYPLRGKEVCGLHIPDNLQILTRAENAAKNNKLIEE